MSSAVERFHDFHDNGAWTSENEVADGPVVQSQGINAIDGDYKLTNLQRKQFLVIKLFQVGYRTDFSLREKKKNMMKMIKNSKEYLMRKLYVLGSNIVYYMTVCLWFVLLFLLTL